MHAYNQKTPSRVHTPKKTLPNTTTKLGERSKTKTLRQQQSSSSSKLSDLSVTHQPVLTTRGNNQTKFLPSHSQKRIRLWQLKTESTILANSYYNCYRQEGGEQTTIAIVLTRKEWRQEGRKQRSRLGNNTYCRQLGENKWRSTGSKEWMLREE
jgi:hypothetical protein